MAGSRRELPAGIDAMKACPSCGTVRGNTRKGWEPILIDGELVGLTCPECPRWREAVRRIQTPGGGVRFRATVGVPGARSGTTAQLKRTFGTLAEAREFVGSVRAEVAAEGRYTAPETHTVRALSEQWLDGMQNLRKISQQGYRGALKPALERLGDRDITTVTVADIELLVAWMLREGGAPRKKGSTARRPVGPRSVKGTLGRLAQVFDAAVRDDLIARNVVRLARRPSQVRKVGTDVQHWPTTGRLAEARCPDRDAFRAVSDLDPLAGAWRLSLAGMTRADVMGLRWSDVDLDAGTVEVLQGRVALAGGTVVDKPKSAQRRRKVPVEVIQPGTVALLRKLRARQAEDRLRAGSAWIDSGLVVVNEIGEPLRPEAYSDRFQKLCTKAGVPVIRLHSLRHTLAFLLHALGVAPADAAALLGHTLEVHLSTYLPAAGQTGIAAAAAALAGIAAAS